MSDEANDSTSSTPTVAALWDRAKKDRGAKGLSRAFKSRKAGEPETNAESATSPMERFASRRGNFDRPPGAEREEDPNSQGYSSDGTAMFPKTAPKGLEAAPVRSGDVVRPSPVGLPFDAPAPVGENQQIDVTSGSATKRAMPSAAPRLQDRVIDVTDLVDDSHVAVRHPVPAAQPAMPVSDEPEQTSAPRRLPVNLPDAPAAGLDDTLDTPDNIDGTAMDVATIIAHSTESADTASVQLPSVPSDVIDLRTSPAGAEAVQQREEVSPAASPLTAHPVARAGETVVSLQSVKAGYGKTKVLSDVSLEAKTGEILAVIGPARSGKSTVLRVLGGLVRPTGGKVYIDGARVQGPLHDALDDAGVAFITVATAHMSDMTVREYLQLTPVEGTQTHDIADVIFASFPHLAVHSGLALGDLKTVDFTILALAQVMVTRPRIIVIDDIGGTLDAGSVAILRSVCRDVADTGVGIVLSHSDPFSALALANHAVILDRGRTTHQGPANHIRDLLSPVHP